MFSLYALLPSRLLDFPFHFTVNGERRSHVEIGTIGERMAVDFLRREKAKILYRNYRGPKGGELDIVIRDKDTLGFVEVKTRKRRLGSRPLDAVNVAKQELIERGARSWISLLHNDDILYRFDVVEVVLEGNSLPQISWVKDAF